MSFNITIDPVKAAAIAAEKADSNRRAAYTAESDPLFFKWQAGEATQEQWTGKRDEIRQRFPKEAA